MKRMARACDREDTSPDREGETDAYRARPGEKTQQPKRKHVKKVKSRMHVWSHQDILKLEQMLCANMKADTRVPPPPPVRGKAWFMLDSGSEPNVADCSAVFPKHDINMNAG